MPGEKWAGVVVENPHVQGYIRKHGTPAYTKPHGADKTIIYYRDTEAEKEEAGEFKDFAGERTPATRTLVIQQPKMGSTEITSHVSSRVVQAPVASLGGTGSIEGNPNRQAEQANVLNEDAFDEEVKKVEEEAKTKREEEILARSSVEEKVSKVDQELTGEMPDVELPHEKGKEKAKEEASAATTTPKKKGKKSNDEPFFG